MAHPVMVRPASTAARSHARASGITAGSRVVMSVLGGTRSISRVGKATVTGVHPSSRETDRVPSSRR